jgi:alanyl-tRNA synthetase
MNAALGGRGGGREMQQGSAACTCGEIEAFFTLRLGE